MVLCCRKGLLTPLESRVGWVRMNVVQARFPDLNSTVYIVVCCYCWVRLAGGDNGMDGRLVRRRSGNWWLIALQGLDKGKGPV